MTLEKLLFPRELQVVYLVSRGHPNKEIAHRLHITEGTVKMYMYNAMKKTGARNRMSLALMYLREHPDNITEMGLA